MGSSEVHTHDYCTLSQNSQTTHFVNFQILFSIWNLEICTVTSLDKHLDLLAQLYVYTCQEQITVVPKK